jgi:hypothetical protein
MPSKHSVEKYMTWSDNLFTLNASVIAYVDIAFLHILEPKAARSRTVIVPMSLSGFKTMACGIDIWRKQHALDCERGIHSPASYSIWAEKSSMLFEAARADCYKSLYFFWMDIGSFHEGPPPPLSTFPAPGFISDLVNGSMLWSVVDVDQYRKYWLAHQKGELERGLGQKGLDCPIATLDGSCFGGDLQAVELWYEQHYKELDEHMIKGWFGGKDQMIFTSVCLHKPQLCTLHRTAVAGHWWVTSRVMLGEERLEFWERQEQIQAI